MADGIIGDNPALYNDKESYRHVGYCDNCDWEGYFNENEKCKQCEGNLISVKIYKKEE